MSDSFWNDGDDDRSDVFSVSCLMKKRTVLQENQSQSSEIPYTCHMIGFKEDSDSTSTKSSTAIANTYHTTTHGAIHIHASNAIDHHQTEVEMVQHDQQLLEMESKLMFLPTFPTSSFRNIDEYTHHRHPSSILHVTSTSPYLNPKRHLHSDISRYFFTPSPVKDGIMHHPPVPSPSTVNILLKDITSVMFEHPNSWLVTLHTVSGTIYDITTPTINARDVFLAFLKTFLTNGITIQEASMVVATPETSDTSNALLNSTLSVETMVPQSHELEAIIDMQKFHDIALKNSFLSKENFWDKFLRWSKRISCDWNNICYCGEDHPRQTTTTTTTTLDMKDAIVSSKNNVLIPTTADVKNDDTTTEVSELEYDLEDFPVTL